MRAPPARPNILFILCHDLGRHLGCYGRPPLATPNIDRLASEGVLFEQHFCAASSCSPSRGCIMTGRYPHSNGLMGLVDLGWELPMSERTLPQYLKQAGYHTALCGIQHERAHNASLSLGYDQVIGQDSGHRAPAKAGAIVDFLNNAPAEPFFLSYGSLEPHRPFRANGLTGDEPAYKPPYLPDNMGVRQQMAGFGRLVGDLDQAVGEILAALQKNGLAERTLVVFSTDHGIDMPRAKGTLYDPGIEAALIMRLPGVIEPGRRCPELVSNVDLLPTLLESCQVGAGGAIQGRSFWPLALGHPWQPGEAVFAEKTQHCHYDPMRCIRTPTHKYIHNFGQLRHMEMPADVEMDCLRDVPDLCRLRRPGVELYDLANDPLELKNLAGSPVCAEIETALRSKLRQWMERTQDPLLQGVLPIPKYL